MTEQSKRSRGKTRRADHYKLVGQTAVPAGSILDMSTGEILDWSQWFETADRRVRLTRVGPYFISTVFLGLDHNFSFQGPPSLFETMVWIGEALHVKSPGAHRDFLDIQKRCSTWVEAVAQHERLVMEIRAENINDPVTEIQNGKLPEEMSPEERALEEAYQEWNRKNK